MNHLEKRGQSECEAYIKHGSSLYELLDQLTSSCGCTESAAGSIVCRWLVAGVFLESPAVFGFSLMFIENFFFLVKLRCIETCSQVNIFVYKIEFVCL